MERYIGKILGGRYEIQEIVGIGGMAIVYRAVDLQTQKDVAVKIMKDEYASNKEFCRRFSNESKAVAALGHRNIVKIMDVSLNDEIQYIVMELVVGITLKEYIDKKGPLTSSESVHLISQVLRALQHAHNKGIIHRDIKPQNIMMIDNGMIKMMDFGIARFSGSETKTMTDKAIGSVHYISPEQASGDEVDQRTDIYSTGVMLYEMLTGKLPFDAENPVSVALMQLQQNPVAPSERNGAIALGLEEIIMRAMQKDPEKRYQSAGEMLRDIEDFKKNPKIKFSYDYFVESTPTRYVDATEKIKSTKGKKSDKANKKKNRKKLDEDLPKERFPVVSVLTGMVLALVIIAGVFFVIAMDMNGAFKHEKEQVTLQSFIGMSFEQAVNSSEFEFTRVDEFSEEIPAGQIMKQSPSGEKMVYANTVVTVYVSKGPQRLQVPDIYELNYTEGVQELTTLNLRSNRIDVYDDDLPEGYIIKTLPSKNSDITAETVVDVYVSIGSKPEILTMPDFSDDVTFEQAKARLISMGLTLKTPEEVDSSKTKNIVVGQDPAPGAVVESGDSVQLQISNGSIALESVKLVIDMPSGLDKKVTIEIIQDDETVKVDTVLTSIINEYEYILEGTGESVVKIVIDNQDYIKYSVNFATGNIKTIEKYDFDI